MAKSSKNGSVLVGHIEVLNGFTTTSVPVAPNIICNMFSRKPKSTPKCTCHPLLHLIDSHLVTIGSARGSEPKISVMYQSVRL